MGVVNVTPDSFSDGGRHFETRSAIDHGLALAADGADLVDVGGESTRPGADRVDAIEEARRVVPVVRELAAAGVRVSIDTMRRETAEAALAAGAIMVNDVSGGAADPGLPRLVAEAAVPYVVMHWRGHSADMQERAEYVDVVGEVCAELSQRLDAVVAAGVNPEQVVLDPGIGFAKTVEHNLALLARLEVLHELGCPIVVGASRKSFLGKLTGRPVDDRELATAAADTAAILHGAQIVRVHDVAAQLPAVQIADAVRCAG